MLTIKTSIINRCNQTFQCLSFLLGHLHKLYMYIFSRLPTEYMSAVICVSNASVPAGSSRSSPCNCVLSSLRPIPKGYPSTLKIYHRHGSRTDIPSLIDSSNFRPTNISNLDAVHRGSHVFFDNHWCHRRERSCRTFQTRELVQEVSAPRTESKRTEVVVRQAWGGSNPSKQITIAGDGAMLSSLGVDFSWRMLST